MHQILQRLRDGQRLACLDRDSRALQHSNDLERVERIPAGRLVHLGEKGPRKRDSKVVVHDMVERSQVDGTDLDAGVALRRKRARELGQQRALQRNPSRGQDADALGTQPPRGVAERSGGGCVEPLDVVDGDEDRRRLGERAQRAENGNSDGAGRGSARRPPRARAHGTERGAADLEAARAPRQAPRRGDRLPPRTTTRSHSPQDATAGREVRALPPRRPLPPTGSSSPCPPRPPAREPSPPRRHRRGSHGWTRARPRARRRHWT